MNITQHINFFVPHTQASNYETAYTSLKSEAKYQMGWPVTNRRIERLTYTSNGKQLTAKVGEAGEYERQYEVVAILESAKYIILTRNIRGFPGPTILVDTKDVVVVQDFRPKAPLNRVPKVASA